MAEAPGTSSTPAEAAPAAAAAPASASAPEPVAAPVTPEAAKGPLFTLPEDVKFPDEVVSKFETFYKSGKLSAQDVVNHYIEQARDANARWEKSIRDLDKSNEAACKELFTSQQFKAAEKAVSFFKDKDPKFGEFAKRQLNDPVFVNLMRFIGESGLREDTFEQAVTPPPKPKSREERMGYAKPKAN